MSIVNINETGTLGRLSWELLEPFGARLHTERLGDGLDETEQALLARLVYEHGFIEAAGQDLDRVQLRLLGGYVSPLFPDEHESNQRLSPDPKEGGFGTRPLEFHRDLAYAEWPFAALALHALDVNPGETSTFIASGTRAYATLPADTKARIADLKVATALSGRDVEGNICWDYVSQPKWPMVMHPLAWPHPVTGVPVLMVCELSSVYVEGLARDESEELLQELFAHNRRADNVYEHRWYDGDLILWDNYGCTHARKKLDGVTKRTLQRLTMGKLSFPIAYPNFSMRDFTDRSQGNNYMGDTGAKF